MEDRPPVRHARVRRNNADDAQRMRDDLIAAALHLFSQGGLDAVSMRAVAARVGVSAMAPYRYFADKSDLLNNLWQQVLWQLHEHVSAAAAKHRKARDRERAADDALLAFWESHPDELRLVQATQRTPQPPGGIVPVYRKLIEFFGGISSAFAKELGADDRHVALAGEVRITLWLGYTNALLNRRYPWADKARLRQAMVERMVSAVADTLRYGERPAPVAAAAAASRRPAERRPREARERPHRRR